MPNTILNIQVSAAATMSGENIPQSKDYMIILPPYKLPVCCLMLLLQRSNASFVVVIFIIVPNVQLEIVNAILVVKLDIGQKHVGPDETRELQQSSIVKKLCTVLAATQHC